MWLLLQNWLSRSRTFHGLIACFPRRRFCQLSGASMRLVQFTSPGSDGRRIGVEESDGGNVVDLNAFDSSLPRNMRAFLEGGDNALDAAKRALESGRHIVSSSNVHLMSPITGPDKVICVGMNYVDHCLEQNVAIPKEPVIFSKFPSSIIGPSDEIRLPAESQVSELTLQNPGTLQSEGKLMYVEVVGGTMDQQQKFGWEQLLKVVRAGAPPVRGTTWKSTAQVDLREVDWEVELAFVIGKKGKNIKEENAMDFVAGFTVAHDVSARDWQMQRNGRQWLLGKTFDTFCPMGPAIVTRDAISDPHNLGIRCKVNGELVQNSNTNQMIFKTEALVSWVSRFVTLYPGDVFLTGTPPGVGVFRKPPVFLKADDVVECEIDELGAIRNKVV